jgi:hypothetical protein
VTFPCTPSANTADNLCAGSTDFKTSPCVADWRFYVYTAAAAAARAMNVPGPYPSAGLGKPGWASWAFKILKQRAAANLAANLTQTLADVKKAADAFNAIASMDQPPTMSNAYVAKLRFFPLSRCGLDGTVRARGATAPDLLAGLSWGLSLLWVKRH